MAITKEKFPDLPPIFDEQRYGFIIKKDKILMAEIEDITTQQRRMGVDEFINFLNDDQ